MWRFQFIHEYQHDAQASGFLGLRLAAVRSG